VPVILVAFEPKARLTMRLKGRLAMTLWMTAKAMRHNAGMIVDWGKPNTPDFCLD
jgi:hypothetical protein